MLVGCPTLPPAFGEGRDQPDVIPTRQRSPADVIPTRERSETGGICFCSAGCPTSRLFCEKWDLRSHNHGPVGLVLKKDPTMTSAAKPSSRNGWLRTISIPKSEIACDL